MRIENERIAEFDYCASPDHASGECPVIRLPEVLSRQYRKVQGQHKKTLESDSVGKLIQRPRQRHGSEKDRHRIG